MKIKCIFLGHDNEYYEPAGQEGLSRVMSIPKCKRCGYDPLFKLVMPGIIHWQSIRQRNNK